MRFAIAKNDISRFAQKTRLVRAGISFGTQESGLIF